MKNVKFDVDLKYGQKREQRIKKMIEEAILDGHIENNYEDAFQYMKKIKSTILN